MKVFWSWQSDRAGKYCRDVIEEALSRAISRLSDELELEPSEGPQLDHDTKDAKGMAAIADHVFDKIKNAKAFVGDVTTVGRSEGGRDLPNPNVLIELGWAWAHLTHENIILVANKYFGPKKPESLPFDIRHRRAVVFYSISKESSELIIEEETVALANDLHEALRTCLADWLTAKVNAPGPEGRSSRDGDASVWFDKNSLLTHQAFFEPQEGLREIEPEEGPRVYVRIIPERFSGDLPNATAVHKHRGVHNLELIPLGHWAAADGGVNREGALRYSVESSGKKTQSVVQWFRDTGELWSFDTDALRDNILIIGRILVDLRLFLDNSLSMLKAFGATGLIRIEIGAVKLVGTKWHDQFGYRHTQALLDSVRISQSRRKWEKAEITDLLLAVANKFAEAYGRDSFDPTVIQRIVNSN